MESHRDDQGSEEFSAREAPNGRLGDRLIEALLADDARRVGDLLLMGTSVDTAWPDGHNSTALHLAALLRSPDCLVEMLKPYVKPAFVANDASDTPLHFSAAKTQSIASVLLLVSIFGLCTTRDVSGNTFFHLLMQNTRISDDSMYEVVEWLFDLDDFAESGLLNVANSRGDTAYDMACRSHPDHPDLLQLLLSVGAMSGEMAWSNRLVALENDEKDRRERIARGETAGRESLSALARRNEKSVRKAAKRRAAVLWKEQSRRGRIAAEEVKVRERLLGRGRRDVEALAAELTVRHGAASTLQRIGRGFLAREDVRELLLSSCATSSVTSETTSDAARLCPAATTRASWDPQSGVSSQRVADDHAVPPAPLPQCVALTPVERQMGKRIWAAYRSYHMRKASRAAALIQATFRGHLIRRIYFVVRRAIITVQRAWRRYRHRQVLARRRATDAIISALTAADASHQLQLFITEATAARQRERIRGSTQAVTQLIWRENFCSAFREIVFMEKRLKPPPVPRTQLRQRWWRVTKVMEPYLLVAQMAISLFLLIYMGCVPRTGPSNVHNIVDITFIGVQLVVTCLLPLTWWHTVDFAMIITALVCAAAGAYGGAIVVTLLLFKVPSLISHFAPEHSGTRTYCRAARYTILYLIALSPFAVAGIGATVRSSCVNDLLLTSNGNWGRVFLFLWSSLAPQYTIQAVVCDGVEAFEESSFPVLNVAASSHWYKLDPSSGASRELLELRMPAVQVVLCQLVLLVFTWAATIVGTHGAIRSHYDISDETKLKANKHRFRNARKMELLDAHRATNMEALGQQLDGVMWEADVRAAKEAVDASHYDHNASQTVHRFVRRVHDSVAQGNLRLDGRAPRPVTLHPKPKSQPGSGSGGAGGAGGGGAATAVPVEEANKWDCRNEDPRTRGTYDIEVIEVALGLQERKGFGERFFERQWTGSVLRRESTIVMVGMLVMASVRPNLFPMEIAFSSVLAIEFVLSLYFLHIEFIFSHYVCFIVRLFCIVVGYTPPALPYVAFRSLRLMEGWSTVFMLPGMVRWGLLYCFVSFLTIWMVTFVALLQYIKTHAESAASPTICNGSADCLAISLRELAIPAWTPQHVRPAGEAPLMATLIIFFQLFFVPFVLTIALHPLLQLSNFIGRFLRLVVQSLHKDVLDYLDSFMEGESWYFHWRIKVPLSPAVITKLKMWVYDSHRKSVLFDSLRHLRLSVLAPFIVPQTTFVDAHINARRLSREGPPMGNMDEIICRSDFASLAENEATDVWSGRLRFWRMRAFTRRPALHYVNFVMTFVSIAFLWVSDTTYSRRHAVTIIAVVFHLLSVLTNIAVFPKDVTATLTFLGCTALIIVVVMILFSKHALSEYYCLRYISLLRLGQLQVFPFIKLKRFIKTYLYSGVEIVFPVLVVGALSYVAQLLRAQIFLVSRSLNFHGATFDSNESSVWHPANLSFPDSLLLSRCTPVAAPSTNQSSLVAAAVNASYEILCTRTRKPGTSETSKLFAHYFAEDAYIFYSIYNYWLLPALCVSTCLAYLYWSGANLLDTHRLTIQLIPLLEDPVTLAQFRPNVRYVRIVGNVILLISLAFGCVFSPSTNATSDDLDLFFGFEVAFAVFGLVESLFSVAFAVHRCRTSWTGWKHVGKRDDSVRVVASDGFILVCEVVELLYYTLAVPLSSTLLRERDDCFIDPDDYATYFITLRFVFLLRMLPRQYILALLKDTVIFFFAAAVIIIYFVGSASALADLAASAVGDRVSPRLWQHAFEELFRQTFTSAAPQSFRARWLPLNATEVAAHVTANGAIIEYISSNYESDRLLFILATVGKALLASAAGVGIAIALVPLRAHAVYPLPEKSRLLYNTLSGGLHRIVRYGAVHQDDMRLDARRKIQARKFARVFTKKGVPSWALPHLLEELDICRPSRQRRFMYALRQLLLYLPISEKRQSKVKRYMDIWDSYRGGAPCKLPFSSLPVFPPAEDSRSSRDDETPLARNPYVGPTEFSFASIHSPKRFTAAAAALAAAAASPDGAGRAIHHSHQQQYIAPLRLVQALALFELGFPADSSMSSKLWTDFFSVVQKLRAATLLQSLWRMYRAEREFDTDPGRTFQERMMIAILRRSFRKNRVRSSTTFRCYDTFSDAVLFDRKVFNPGTGHYDVLSRLSGHYASLSPTQKFKIKEDVAPDPTEVNLSTSTSTATQYVARYLQLATRRRAPSVSHSHADFTPPPDVFHGQGV